MTIGFTLGNSQQFRFRTRDLTFPGRVTGMALPARRAAWRLNDSASVPFHVEAIPDDDVDWVAGYKDSPAQLRCKELGDFVIEVPADHAALSPGDGNRLVVEAVDAAGAASRAEVVFSWDPRPLPVTLDLRDLSPVSDLQTIAQLVAGRFEIDRARNVIRSVAPVVPDACLVLGSPHRDQEATYRVVFTGFDGVKWLGPSDFFVGFEDRRPPIGIKTGWSSAGMMALNPAGEARCFIAWGDHSDTPDEWVVVTDPPARVALSPGTAYRVRHRVSFASGVDRCRFRIWPERDAEPDAWLCQESDSALAPDCKRHTRASFALFQHSGTAVEWSNICVGGP